MRDANRRDGRFDARLPCRQNAPNVSLAGGGMESAIAGCDIVDVVYRSSRTTVYRGFRRHDGRPVVVKALTDAFPRPRDLALLRR